MNKIYCISNGKYVKIGTTKDIERRFKTLSSLGGFEIKDSYYQESCKKLEKIAHDNFKDKKVFGEWFDIDFNEAVIFLKENITKEKQIKTEKSKTIVMLEELKIDAILYFNIIKPMIELFEEYNILEEAKIKIKKDLENLSDEEKNM